MRNGLAINANHKSIPNGCQYLALTPFPLTYQDATKKGSNEPTKMATTRLKSFWIAYAIAFGAWWCLYFFVSDRMTDLGIGWINAMYPNSDIQYSLASKLTIAKHIVFAVLMIAALVFLARHYPSYRNWAYGLGLVWNVFNGVVIGVPGLIAIVALSCAGV